MCRCPKRLLRPLCFLKPLLQLCPLNGQWACKCHSAYCRLVKLALESEWCCSLSVQYKCKIVTTAISHIYKCVGMADWTAACVSRVSSEEKAGLFCRKFPPSFFLKNITKLNVYMVHVLNWMLCTGSQRRPGLLPCACCCCASVPRHRSMVARSKQTGIHLSRVKLCNLGMKERIRGQDKKKKSEGKGAHVSRQVLQVLFHPRFNKILQSEDSNVDVRSASFGFVQ